MNKIKFILALFSLSVFFTSCTKDDTPPTITISSPLEGATLDKGQTYPIVGIVTDDTELKEIDAAGVKITTFDSKTSHVLANLSLPIPPTATVGDASFTVTATDVEGNIGTKVVKFKIK